MWLPSRRISFPQAVWLEAVGVQLEISVQGTSLVVRITGELDVLTAEQFRRQVEAALERHRARNLYLNLSGVTFIDSSGLGAILGRYKRVRQAGGRMALVSPTRAIRPVLEMAGLYRLMEVLDSETGSAG